MAPWYSDKKTQISGPSLNDEACSKNKELANACYNRLYPVVEFSTGRFHPVLKLESSAIREWLSTALRSSTGHDRIFAMAHLVNLYPMYCVRYLDSLISLVNPAKQRDCIRAIDVLHQLFVCTLLPRHRPLIPFSLRPTSLKGFIADSDEREKAICLWLFEDQLKSKFLHFIKSLERLLLGDTGESFKRKALNALVDLSVKLLENRSLILGIIVNKLGDRSKVLASSVIHHLRNIVGRKRELTDLVIEEVRSLLFRPNLQERVKYYSLVFLSCVELRKKCVKSDKLQSSSETALNLVKIYSAFFHGTVKSSEVPERLVTVLLTGLSRAAPFVPENQLDQLVEEIDDIFRLVHTSTFNVALQSLAVLFQLATIRVDLRTRYYQALYRKLRDPQLLLTSRGPTVLHMIYRSMLADADLERGAAFAQRLLELCLLHPSPGFVVGILILLGKVQASKKCLIVSTQAPVVSQHFENGTNSSEEDEYFSDAPDSDNAMEVDTVPVNIAQHPESFTGSWDHRKLGNVMRSEKTTSTMHNRMNTSVKGYRPDAREPLFARAGGHPSWPLVLLTNHAHPTVALFAKTLLRGDPVVYTGDPFEDFSLLHFLDRFAFKKPKISKKSKRRAPPGRPLQRHEGVGTGSRAFPVNSAMFRQLAEDRVAADEQFFHNYAKFSEAHTGTLAERTRRKDESDDSVSDDEFDAYLEQYESGLIPPDEESRGDDEPEFDIADFSDHSDGDNVDPDSEEEAAFLNMDGIMPSTSAKNVSKSASFLHRPRMDVDLDAHDASDQSVDDDSDTDDGEAEPQKFGRGTNKIMRLFASAEEVGKLYDVQETPKQRKRQLREEKRTLTRPDRSKARRSTTGNVKQRRCNKLFKRERRR